MRLTLQPKGQIQTVSALLSVVHLIIKKFKTLLQLELRQTKRD